MVCGEEGEGVKRRGEGVPGRLTTDTHPAENVWPFGGGEGLLTLHVTVSRVSDQCMCVYVCMCVIVVCVCVQGSISSFRRERERKMTPLY